MFTRRVTKEPRLPSALASPLSLPSFGHNPAPGHDNGYHPFSCFRLRSKATEADFGKVQGLDREYITVANHMRFV